MPHKRSVSGVLNQLQRKKEYVIRDNVSAKTFRDKVKKETIAIESGRGSIVEQYGNNEKELMHLFFAKGEVLYTSNFSGTMQK